FLEAYDFEDIKFWGITIQNEPSSGSNPDYPWQTMFFSGETERNFIKNLLGPLLKNSTIGKDLAVMVMDDQRHYLPTWADIVLADEEAGKYVSGIAVHWYGDFSIPPGQLLSETHQHHPRKFILATEACNGANDGIRGPILGDWYRGDNYAHDIITDLSNWVSGWIDWNICLDLQGGPNWVQNFVDSPVIVNATAGEFYKQPMFYVMGHFSKFIRPDSRRVGLTISNGSAMLEGVAITTPSRQRVLVLNNRDDHQAYELSIKDAAIDRMAIRLTLEPRTIATIFIRPDSRRVGLTISNGSAMLEGVAITTPSRQRVLVLNNRDDHQAYELSIKDAAIDRMAIRLTLEPRTIATIVWNKEIAKTENFERKL
uniref:Glucosylceramidase n=1 Tax=Ascaris lumbricoides TaxID=6252 RepID=A0A0M3HW45_ASCLU